MNSYNFYAVVPKRSRVLSRWEEVIEGKVSTLDQQSKRKPVNVGGHESHPACTRMGQSTNFKSMRQNSQRSVMQGRRLDLWLENVKVRQDRTVKFQGKKSGCRSAHGQQECRSLVALGGPQGRGRLPRALVSRAEMMAVCQVVR